MTEVLPLVSCIIPIFNAEQYIERCLESVLEQDYSNLEIVLIDDGSTDKSGEICDKYQQENGNIKVAHIPNGGASLARRKGLELATGDYVTFVDSDDYFSPYYVSELYALIEKYHVNISACNVKRVQIDEQPGVSKEHGNDYLLGYDELMTRFFKYKFWGFPGKMYLKDVFNDIVFPKATMSEDYFVMTQLFLRERQMAYTEKKLYYYEYHENSLSHTSLSEKAFGEFENVEAVYEKVKVDCPQFADYALANAIETAVKLCCMRDDDNKFTQNYAYIYRFLSQNKRAILSDDVLNRNVKWIAFGLAVSPYLVSMVCRQLNRR